MSEQVILVNVRDEEIGAAAKLDVHRVPQLHRAFSVFLFNAAGELLLQRRAAGKYHSAGRWSNACCGHPRPGEAVDKAARRRLIEEMGIACPLVRGPSFIYRAVVDDALTEYELDHLFVGTFEGEPDPDPAEVSEWRWIAPAALRAELQRDPRSFTVWFEGAFSRILPLAPPPARCDTPADSERPALRRASSF